MTDCSMADRRAFGNHPIETNGATIFDHLLRDANGDLQLGTLPNEKDQGYERWLRTRDEGRIRRFVEKHDVSGQAVYFCVSTLKPGKKRRKENAVALPWIFTDIDFKMSDLSPQEIERRLRGLQLPPSRLHHSGNGFHGFWTLHRPVLADGMDAAEVLLRRIANHLGGDKAVAHRVALLRVPGSHNSKRGGWKEVQVIQESAARYTPAEIAEWLDGEHEPVMVRRDLETNPYVRLSQEQGYRPPLDWRAELDAMTHGSVHDSQLKVTASLTCLGIDEEDIVELVLNYTMRLPETQNWNWGAEERTIREMCRDAARKFKKTGARHV